MLNADQMQLLKAEQALAAVANGTAIARAVVVRASGDTGAWRWSERERSGSYIQSACRITWHGIAGMKYALMCHYLS